MLFAGLQTGTVKKRYKQGGRWHSRCIGIPRFAFMPVWLEKALPIIAGIWLLYMKVPLPGLLLILSSGISILLRWNEARAFKNQVLDMIDGQIEQEHLGKAVMERSKPQDVEGLRAPLPAYVSQQFRQKIVEAFGNVTLTPRQEPQAQAA